MKIYSNFVFVYIFVLLRLPPSSSAVKQVIDDGSNEENGKLEKFESMASWLPKEVPYTIGSDETNTNDDTIESFDIDDAEHVPVDLTNDIAINQMLADEGAAVNPDAEIFDIHQYHVNREDEVDNEPKSTDKERDEAVEYLPFYPANMGKIQKMVVDQKWWILAQSFVIHFIINL